MTNLLYKFRKIDKRTRKVLKSKSLFFPKPNQLNDPIDCQLDISSFLEELYNDSEIGQIAREISTSKIESNNTNPVNFIKQLQDCCGVFCLSKNSRESLLWSHYANGHQGIAIGFDKTQFQLNAMLKKNLIRSMDVKYSRTPNLLDQIKRSLKECSNSSTIYNEIISTILSIKSINWQYESEFRFLSEKSGPHNFDPKSLHEIIFGAKAGDDSHKIIEIIKSDPAYRHVRFKKAKFKANSFEMEIEDYVP